MNHRPEKDLQLSATKRGPVAQSESGSGRWSRWRPWRRYWSPGIPVYLARHYWWAYLSRAGIWFFDHQAVINAVLLGQYRELRVAAQASLGEASLGRVLQAACVYGDFTTSLVEHGAFDELHVLDVVEPQLQRLRGKLGRSLPRVVLARMNVESLAYPPDAFDTVIAFFLLHEMPAEARRRTLAETMRVIGDGGRLLVVEYGELDAGHWLHRIAATRLAIERLEPFLAEFWRGRLHGSLAAAAASAGKRIECERHEEIFGGFYRVAVYRIVKATAAAPER